ncbi:hypothetical protein BCR34DRAFT_572675 [Clohesyomyces aquaticus]|uniref:Uncharacterized protein n=1 Tax=Clohesyomyces aquaticus TaxID=1231657 RepID=A0A1Y1Z2D1_9PLEO|nr:hypothetical protein BCR34DRAFT_572675 [Clohesyomyces aquaticus]
MLTWEVSSLLISGCFLALGICVARLEGKPESPWSSRVIQATRIAPSIWPIIFSGVLGTAIKAFADWKAERGVSLLALEQLLGSLTMASSIITMFRWSIPRASSAVLILLWAFNPLGSQASLRGAYLQSRTGSSEGLIHFFNSNHTWMVPFSVFSKETPGIHMQAIVPAVYTSTLHDVISSLQYVNPTNDTAASLVADLGSHSSSGIQAATDNWGNIRIPHLRYLSNYDAKNPKQWLETSWDKKILNYSSLVGDRIDGVDRAFTGNTSFNVTTSYQDFSCAPWFNLNVANSNGKSSNSSQEEQWFDSPADVWLRNKTARRLASFLSPPDYPNSLLPLFVTTIFERPTNNEVFGMTFVFAQYRGLGYALSLTKCSPRTVYVDANVICVSRGISGKMICGVVALRESPNPPAASNMTIFDYPLAVGHGSDSFGYFLINSVSFGQASSTAEYYMMDPLTALTGSRNGNSRWTDPQRYETVDLSSLHIEVFEQRFSLLANTLWKISVLRQTVVGGNMSSLGDDQDLPAEMFLRNTTSRVTFPLPSTFKISKAWLAVYFVAAFVMLIAATFALLMHAFCRAPAILGYVSSLIRDSTFFDDFGMYKNSMEDGVEKTKRLGELRVMIADVGSGTDGVGKIAFAPVGAGERVRKRRMYM